MTTAITSDLNSPIRGSRWCFPSAKHASEFPTRQGFSPSLVPLQIMYGNIVRKMLSLPLGTGGNTETISTRQLT